MANPNGTGGAGGGQPDLSQSPGGWGYGSFGDPFGAFGCRVDGFDYPQAMCIQHLANGTGDFVQHHDQPGFLGHWIDVDDPNPPPFPPGTPPDAVRGGSVIAKFVPFPIWIPGFAGAGGGGDDDWKSPFHFFSSDTKLSDGDCDIKLSRIFGGVAKAMEDGLDIDGLNRKSAGAGSHSATPGTLSFMPDGKRNDDNGGIIHVYTDKQASKRKDISLFAPGGWLGKPSAKYDSGYSKLFFNYSGGITIAFVHVGTSNEDSIPTIPENPGAGSLAEIGFVGGAGGEGSLHNLHDGNNIVGKVGYTHTHIVFFSNYSKNIRIDPRKIFCGW